MTDHGDLPRQVAENPTVLATRAPVKRVVNPAGILPAIMER